MEKFLIAIGAIVTGLFIVVIAACILALPTMWLWNWLMPNLFGVKTITFLQAMGVNMLTGILFKSSNTTKGEKK